MNNASRRTLPKCLICEEYPWEARRWREEKGGGDAFSNVEESVDCGEGPAAGCIVITTPIRGSLDTLQTRAYDSSINKPLEGARPSPSDAR